MILLLDSEPVVRSVLKNILETAGYVVLATGSLGVAANELARCKIDLLITSLRQQHPRARSGQVFTDGLRASVTGTRLNRPLHLRWRIFVNG
jgi:CheY-like chemotaxis protein